MKSLVIPILLGTGREGRRSEIVAKGVLEQATRHGLESWIIDPRAFGLTATTDEETNEMVRKYRAEVDRADGFIIVTPEYNHGYPGELKIMLDMAYNEYARKPVGICGVSTGQLGGGRAVEQLKLVAVELGMVVLRPSVYFPKLKSLVNEQGVLEDETLEKRAEPFFEELIWYAEALKKARTA